MDGWLKEILDKPHSLETLDKAGANRHRVESFKIAMKVSKIRNPKTVFQLEGLMLEYIRQVVGPEIFDLFKDVSTTDNVDELFASIKNYITGEKL